jgi:LysM repeat protein
MFDAIMSRRLILMFSILLLVLTAQPTAAAGVWGTRPLLSYFALTASLEIPFKQGTGLTAYETRLVEYISRQEAEALSRLDRLSQPVIQDPGLDLAEKQRRIAALGYNRQVDAIVYTSDLRLRQSLTEAAYDNLVNGIERRWPIEQRLHGTARLRMSSNLTGVRSYEVFATRYDSKGAYTVALPDQCLKFANGGLHMCDSKGYIAGAGYSVAISYKSGLGVRVGEAGPWNIEDNYWASAVDPQPRRMFADLPVGMPEAQAAYFNGYNGGKDQYGRKVTSPFAIDLAFKVGDDIGLPAKKNDWITVSFLWTKDWGSKPGKQAGNTPGATLVPGSVPVTPSELILSVELATPAADGSIIHIVKSGQTLWTIAVAYRVRVAQIQFLNNMGQTVVIYEGQKLKIKEAGPTWTPVPGTAVSSGATETPQPPTETPTPPLPVRQTQKAERRTHIAASAENLTRTVSAVTETATTANQFLSTTGSPTHAVDTASLGGSSNSYNFSDRRLLIGALILALGGALIFGLGWLFGTQSKKKPAEKP